MQIVLVVNVEHNKRPMEAANEDMESKTNNNKNTTTTEEKNEIGMILTRKYASALTFSPLSDGK